MKLIVGLGNPGFRYRKTRHNVGFLVARKLAKKFRIPLKKKKYNGVYGEGLIENEKTALLLPETYMNLSGEAVKEALKKRKIGLEGLLVICDDIDLKLGFIRIRNSGSSGGHKGLKSIIENLGTDEFHRLRVGIGRDYKIGDVVNFVLSPFESGEKVFLKGTVKEAVECAAAWVKFGPEYAMARFNKRQPA